jgi:murein DD-endopeptidase MepM/ murein hydrolase activator NlpD
MPGAPRHYRLGVHEGADFYWRQGALVYAASAGRVIRADHDYLPPLPAEFARWRAEAGQLGYTSAEALDFFRGRQVWLQHADDLVSRYVHLDSIAAQVQVGATVSQGQLIGTVGNSGSPGSLEGEGIDAHLHFELWRDNHYLGQFLRPVETRYWLERILLNGGP